MQTMNDTVTLWAAHRIPAFNVRSHHITSPRKPGDVVPGFWGPASTSVCLPEDAETAKSSKQTLATLALGSEEEEE
jgi:hypothetical protein